MQFTTNASLDNAQENLVRAVLFQFAISDYDGGDALSLNGIMYSDIFEHATQELVNKALSVAQNAGLIEWDAQRVGAVHLTDSGMKKLLLVRRDFFDDDKNEALKDALSILEREIS